MKNLKICVVGLGVMGRLHMSKLTKMKEVVVCGIDSDIKKIRSAEKEFRVPIFQKITDVLGKIDAAVISTPTFTHHMLGKELLNSGIHLFVEKPLAENIQDARKLCEIARNKKRILQVGHIERFNPSFCRLKLLIDKPYMLAFYRLSPFPGRSLDIDVVMDLMIHDIDLSLNLVKSSVKKIEAYGYRFISNKPDVVIAKIIFNNNCIANFISSRVYTRKVRKFYVFEKGKYMIGDLLNFKLLSITAGVDKTIEHEEKITPYDMIEAELRSFINSIKNKKKPAVTGEEGTKAIKVAAEIQQKIFLF